MKTGKGYSPLQYAISLGLDDMVNVLSQHDKVNMNQDDPEGFTPLARYVLAQKFDMARKLLSRGADVNATNHEGKSALIIAIEDENHPAVKFLLERNAYPHIEDVRGWDACDYAARAQDAVAYRGVFEPCRSELR
jgi:ankyrin repeat protein